MPPDLDQTFSSVREAQAALIQSAAQLGVVHSYNQTPKEMLDGVRESRLGRHRPHVRPAGGRGARRQAGRGQARGRQARPRPGRARPSLLRHRRRDRRRRHAPQRQPGQQRPGRPGPHGDPLARRDLGRRQFQGDAARATCASASRSTSTSTCTAAGRRSRAASPASPWGPARRWRCCRRRTPRATSSRSCSGCRCASTSWTTTRRRARCSSACRSTRTSTSTSRRPGRTPASSSRPTRRRRPPAAGATASATGAGQ